MADRLYTVEWSRTDGETLTCTGLTLRQAAARLINAIHHSGPITVHKVTIER